MGDAACTKSQPEIILRWPKPGEWGWVMQQHGSLYWNEYAFPEGCERFVGEAVCEMMAIKNTSPRSRVWIATINNNADEPLGCIFLQEHSENKEIGRLRLFLVHPNGRGFGVGTKLLNECIEFAKENGYKKITLWTHTILKDAKRLYDKAGFKVTTEEKHNKFGPDFWLIGQTLELDL